MTSRTRFRTTLADCVARTRETHRPIILTQNGRASSVFLDVADWEKIAEALDDAKTQRGFLISEGQHARGEPHSISERFKPRFMRTVCANESPLRG